MAAIRVVLYEEAGRSIEFTGTSNPGNGGYSLSELVVPGGGATATSSLVTPFDGDIAAHLEDLDGSGIKFRFKTSVAIAVKFESELLFSDTLPFNVPFDPSASVCANVVLRLETTAGLGGAFVLKMTGHVAASGAVSPIAFVYEVVIDDLPTVLFATMPSLCLRMPECGIDLPNLELNWDLSIPAPPYRFPARSFALDPLPIRVAYRLVEVDVVLNGGDSIVTVDFRGLIASAFGPECEFEFVTFTITPDGTVTAEAKLIRPTEMTAPLPNWHLETGCMLLWGTGQELNQVLAWMIPELDGLALHNSAEWRLRILYDEMSVTELRVDLTSSANERIQLPGFEIDLPIGATLTLLLAETASGHQQWLALRLPSNESITASCTLRWQRDTDCELLHDSENPSKKLLFLTLNPKDDITLLPLARDDSGLYFFKKSSPSIALIDPNDELTRCEPTLTVLADLLRSDLRVDPHLNVDANVFHLPFLSGDSRGTFQQFLTITQDGAPTLDAGGTFFACRFNITAKVGSLALSSGRSLKFYWRDMRFVFDHDDGLDLVLISECEGSLFGMEWLITPSGSDRDFRLLTAKSDYRFKKEAAQITLRFTRATADGSSIDFNVTDLELSPGGLSFKAEVLNSKPAKLRAVNTEFLFTTGTIEVRDNRIAAFALEGTGSLPPALVGPSTVGIFLNFEQDQRGHLRLKDATAELKGITNLRNEGTRFRYAVSALGLEVYDDGDYHFYFTISGTATFELSPGDDDNGPLGQLGKIGLTLVQCPLTDDTSVLKDHVKFLIALPTKPTFRFLQCFDFELRAIEFIPHDTVFGDGRPGVRITGQVNFAQGGGDAVNIDIDFHDLHIGRPDPGSLIPKLHLKGLAVSIGVGSSFQIGGMVNFIDEGSNLGGGVQGEGFSGTGDLTIQGLPKFTAGFAFLRVRRSPSEEPVRAWFLYLQASRMSIEVPVIQVFLREVGLGFGYRFTLAMIKSADELDDPKQLLRRLKDQARSQGDLQRFDQWRVDLGAPDESPRWTVVFRALLAEKAPKSAATFNWDDDIERKQPCLFLVDVLAAIRSDMTFLMVGRAWLWANYRDFDRDVADDGGEFRNRPLFAAFVLLSPRKKRLLANLSSNADFALGEQGKPMGWLRPILKGSNFSATLLVEPGLVHYELGWPNQLRWEADFGVLKVSICGGMIVRVSQQEFVIGQSFLARGTLSFSAGVDLGFVGARLSATANVAYGARYIGVASFEDPANRSAFYGALGIDINVRVSVVFWVEIETFLGSLTKSYNLSSHVNFTASVEVGMLLTPEMGVRGTATVSLSIMGHDLQFGIKIGDGEDVVDTAKKLTERFLSMGLEAGDVEPVPGTSSMRTLAHHQPPAISNHVALVGEQSACECSQFQEHDVDVAAVATYSTPEYVIQARAAEGNESVEWSYFLCMPAGQRDDDTRETGFLPPPYFPGDQPGNDHPSDFAIRWTTTPPAGVDVQQLRADGTAGNLFWVDASSGGPWKLDWEFTFPGGFDSYEFSATTNRPTYRGAIDFTLRHWLSMAFRLAPINSPHPSLEDLRPDGDPDPLPEIADEETLEDQRVYVSAEDSYEPAVRGSNEEVQATPYLRHSNADYDQVLTRAFSPYTSIYARDGRLLSVAEEEELLRCAKTGNAVAVDMLRATQRRSRDKANINQQAHQMRGTIVRGLMSEFEKLAANPSVDPREVAPLAMQLGVVFRVRGTGSIKWLGTGEEDASALATIEQRNDPGSADLSGTPQPARIFNRDKYSFALRRPRLDGLIHVAHPATVALSWKLRWDRDVVSPKRMENPEHHLDHYRITRRAQDGSEQERAFTVKASSVLHVESGLLKRCLSRFQVVDHFNSDTDIDLANLPPQGRSYIYTITPVDTNGRVGESYTQVVVRKPSTPPQAISRSELLIEHLLPLEGATLTNGTFAAPFGAKPIVRPPQRISFVWEPPADPPQGPIVAIAGIRLIFRRDAIVPAGSYGADTEAAGPRSRGLPTSNARPLRTDICVSLSVSEDHIHVDDSTGVRRYFVALSSAELIRLGVLPATNAVQTLNPSGSIDGGSWKMTFEGDTTKALPFDATKSKIQSALEALDAIDPGDVVVTGGPINSAPVTLEFQNGLARADIGQITIDAALVGVNPTITVAGRGSEWLPHSWQVFVQTRSSSGVFSALTPVVVVKRFRSAASDGVNSSAAAQIQRQTEKDEERRFGSLEWIPFPVALPVHQPRDVGGDSGFALVPLPDLTNSGDQTIGIGAFGRHPRRRRAVRLVWNPAPSAAGRVVPVEEIYPTKLTANFELYQFDSDAHTAGVLNVDPSDPKYQSHVDFDAWVEQSRLQRVQEVEVLDEENARLSPADTTDVRRWEAWYPSVLRRQYLRSQDPSPIADQPLSNWYSWRESFLQWPAHTWTPPGGTELDMLDEAGNRLLPRHPLLTWLAETAASGDAQSLDPHLQEAFRVIWSDPPRPQGDLEDLLAATDPQGDAYGWGLLQRCGLSNSFHFIDRESGDAISPELLLLRIKWALEQLAGDLLKPHIFCEWIYRQAKATRVPPEEVLSETANEERDLQSIMQISLRPRPTPYANYYRSPPIRPRNDMEGQVVKGTLEIGPLDAALRVNPILQTSRDQELAELHGGEAPRLITLTRPASGELRLLFRAYRNDENPIVLPDVTIHWTLPDGSSEETRLREVTAPPTAPEDLIWEPFHATEVLSSCFNVAVESVEFWSPKARSSWLRLDTYLRGIAPPLAVPGNDTKRQYALPIDEKTHTLDVRADPPGRLALARRIFLWLNRFFDHGASNDAATSGPWMATAYAYGTTPVPVQPDPLSGRLVSFLPVEDQYAHCYRYYIRPRGRYDRLWQSLGQSRSLNRDLDQRTVDNVIQSNLTTLRTIPRPAAGGFDVSLNRIRPLSPPVVRYCGRVEAGPIDDPETDAVWQVIVDQHAEQRLIECNRTLQRQLAFRQIAVTLHRRFQSVEALAPILSWISDYRTRPYSSPTTQTVAPTSNPHVVVVVDGATVNLDLAGMNHLDGLCDAITHSADPNLGGISAKVEHVLVDQPAEPHAHVLRVTCPATVSSVQLLVGLATPDHNLLVNSRLSLDIVPAVGGDGGLPLANWTPEKIPQEETLGVRIGKFDHSCQVWTWRSLPYFYEHRLTAIAQAANVVSAPSAVSQRDFNYYSPEPEALLDAALRPGSDPPIVERRVRIRLGTFWRCLDSATHVHTTQDRWPAENPYATNPHTAQRSDPRRPAGLPDPAVVYQLVLRRPGDVIQVLSEFRADQPDASQRHYAAYSVQNFPGRVGGVLWTSEVSALLPWKSNPARPEDMYLETRLILDGQPPRVTARRAITSRHAFNLRQPPKQWQFGLPPSEASLVTLKVLTNAELNSLRAVLTPETRDYAFRAAANRFLERLQSLLDAGNSDEDEWRKVGEPVSIGLEQLREIAPASDKIQFVVAGNDMIVEWHGELDQTAKDAISAMAALSTFNRTLLAIRDAPPDLSDPHNPISRATIVEEDWTPRPSFSDFTGGLEACAMYCEGIAQFEGLMSPEIAQLLLDPLLNPEVAPRLVDKDAVRRLYVDALKNSFAGDLQVRAYRGAALIRVASVTPIQP